MSGKISFAGSKSGILGQTEIDYEEGIYTVAPTSGTGSWTLGTYNTFQYTKIGRVVNINGEVRCTSVSSPSGACMLSIPFTSANRASPYQLSTKTGSVCSTYSWDYGSGATVLGILLYDNATFFYLLGSANGANHSTPVGDAGNELALAFHYITDLN